MPSLSNIENPTEDQESEAFSQWLTLKGLPHTHIGNESGRGRTAMLRTAKLKRMGQSKGFPDYLVVVPAGLARRVVDLRAEGSSYALPVKYYAYRLVAVEMKRRKGGKLSPEQKQWLEILNSAGIESVVCRGFDEARKFVEDRI
ncbi:MAG: VRR-NUC domain-containing protein [Candidatus Saccharimonadales bacterium]